MKQIRVLSFNIQTGIRTTAYHQYFTRGWQHLLPSKRRDQNLQDIAQLLTEYDIIGLQEVDGGSFRSRFRGQGEQLAAQAGLPFYHTQRTRNLGIVAQHGNAILCRSPMHRITNATLPGQLPGRGMMLAELDPDTILVNTHLALNAKVQANQLRHIVKLIDHYPHKIVMGDFNAPLARVRQWLSLMGSDLQVASGANTYPSWRPSVALDHILVSPSLRVEDYTILPYTYSDHLPVAATIGFPSVSNERS